MRFLNKLQMRLRMLFYRKREVRRLVAELDFHIDQQTNENIARGMAPIEARQAALRAFGNPGLLRERAGEQKQLVIPVHGKCAFVDQEDYQTNCENSKDHRHDSQHHKPPRPA